MSICLVYTYFTTNKIVLLLFCNGHHYREWWGTRPHLFQPPGKFSKKVYTFLCWYGKYCTLLLCWGVWKLACICLWSRIKTFSVGRESWSLHGAVAKGFFWVVSTPSPPPPGILHHDLPTEYICGYRCHFTPNDNFFLAAASPVYIQGLAWWHMSQREYIF